MGQVIIKEVTPVDSLFSGLGLEENFPDFVQQCLDEDLSTSRLSSRVYSPNGITSIKLGRKRLVKSSALTWRSIWTTGNFSISSRKIFPGGKLTQFCCLRLRAVAGGVNVRSARSVV